MLPVGRPVLTTRELEEMGYKMLIDAQGALFASAKAVVDAYTALRDQGLVSSDHAGMRSVRLTVENLLGLEEHYRIEEETVEAPPQPKGKG